MAPPLRKTSITHDQGLSLIELVVALALFALVATMATQGLTGMLRLRDSLSTRSDSAAELARATSLLRHDLSNAVPMPFFTPGGGPIRSAITEDNQAISLSIGGQPTRHTDMQAQPVFHRVEWIFQPGSGQLLRRRWATLSPLNATSLSPEVAILPGVTEVRLRSFWGELGWVNGVRPPSNAAAQPSNLDADGGQIATTAYSSNLPDGVEITLVTEAHGKIVLLEALK